MKATTTDRLSALIAAESLPASYRVLVRNWLEPMAGWLAARRLACGRPLLVGINGAQGTGKTTLCRVLQLLLGAAGWRCATLSLDDFYLGKRVRQQLGRDVHPLLATRGVPGTHDVSLLDASISALLGGKAVTIPRFDKAQDDRVPPPCWRHLEGGVDLLFLEGWCIGCPPQDEQALEQAVNALEAEEDGDRIWRHYVNDCLAGPYAALFARLDCLVMLQAPSMEAVREWRKLQERKLAKRREGASAIMDEEGIARFVQHYERLTRHALQALPERADYLLRLDSHHGICGGGPQ